MQLYAESLTEYKRLQTLEVNIGGLLLGNGHPIRIQTMTTTDTMDTMATVEQSIRCIEAGSELIRITAPSKNEAENLLNISNELRRRGYNTPLVADIHFTPNAAEIAARIVEKVRINPGNYVDKKKFEILEYTDEEYLEETDRIRDRFTPLVKICKEYGTAMRIGTNHGSLSDRIMSRYGDTPIGMVESAMEFLRIAEDESYRNIVLSMKSSNPQVMVQAYRMLIEKMQQELGHCYPLHLGVTEAGDGEDGRIKSAIGIGTLLEDGIGDTIRVSLTEDPEFELPVCKELVSRYVSRQMHSVGIPSLSAGEVSLAQGYGGRRPAFEIENIGSKHVPVVISDLSKIAAIEKADLSSIGYRYDEETNGWKVGDAAADFIFTGNKEVNFALPAGLKMIQYFDYWKNINGKDGSVPIFDAAEYMKHFDERSQVVNFVMVDCYSEGYPGQQLDPFLEKLAADKTAVICLSSTNQNAVQSIRRMFMEFAKRKIHNPVVIICDSAHDTYDKSLIHYAVEAGALLLNGMGDGICLGHHFGNTSVATDYALMNSIAFGILQATRTRISKTDYISCPSCGRTLFDLQETTAKIRAVTNHLKGLKIAIMGCIVNGPGEMADADFGYVGSGSGKITLYKGKEIVKRALPSEVAVDELIQLIKDNGAWEEVTKN